LRRNTPEPWGSPHGHSQAGRTLSDHKVQPDATHQREFHNILKPPNFENLAQLVSVTSTNADKVPGHNIPELDAFIGDVERELFVWVEAIVHIFRGFLQVSGNPPQMVEVGRPW
jgi:hypothetical protein